MMMSLSIVERFWSKVDFHTKAPCWEWRAGKHKDGYGHLKIEGKMVLAHRFAYQHLVGAIPQDKELDHLCKNRLCVNPTHLEAVEHKTNVLRGKSPSALCAKKTHCLKGHPLSGYNLTSPKRGGRVCKTCANEWHRRNYATWGRSRKTE